MTLYVLRSPGTAWRFLLLPAVTLGVGMSASISRFLDARVAAEEDRP